MPADHLEVQVDATREWLRGALLRLTPETGKTATVVKGLTLTRWVGEGQTDACFFSPSISLVVQGHKESIIGSEVFSYGGLDCLVNGVDMPSNSRVVGATPEKPFLAVAVDVDKNIVADLAAKIPPRTKAGSNPIFGVFVSKVAGDVLDAFARLVEGLDKPGQLQVMAPLLIREIIAKTLMGMHGDVLRAMCAQGTPNTQIAEAVFWLRENYALPLAVDELAARVGMTTPTFYRQFKNVTSLSPLQYQKHLRLYEAKRLMLAEKIDANNAGGAVGYGNIQQFNREYKRLFGEPPHRDIKKLIRT